MTMSEMADPHLGLLSFQQAMTAGLIDPRPAKYDQGLMLFVDQPDENMRITYALADRGVVKGTVLFVPAESYDGEPRFSVGYAVAQPFRGQGIATDLLKRSINDLSQGIKARPFWLEAIVDEANVASRRVCEKVLTSEAEAMNESISGRPSLNFLTRISAPR
jgi:GNAT superfamily N-acetyltransferase